MARLVLLILALLLAAPAQAQDEAKAWEVLRRGGGVAVIRHALAPGIGDPSGFKLDDCSTQRNLSEQGRAQARALGERLRAEGVAVSAVLSSRWCRCLETARLAFGTVTPFPPLDSFFEDRGEEPARTAAVRDHMKAWDGRGTLVMVTHQVNITALTGAVPSSGEIVVLGPNPDRSFALVGRIRLGDP
ncbi:histidine phosphatase family protein [Aerophototrophica crusticola]|uniref:Histidine phosphatase family protein n=1 Tax=Aerophototrophica crusticola TaxID=1709002 RepID=A0A858R8Z0_9PROT|nr:histidine phosphatase family protein [Rhodospirillaceae bacterium B3]